MTTAGLGSVERRGGPLRLLMVLNENPAGAHDDVHRALDRAGRCRAS